MRNAIAGAALVLAASFAGATEAEAVTPQEAVGLTVEEFNALGSPEERGAAIYYASKAVYNYYNANSQQQTADCMVILLTTPLVEGSRLSVLETDINIELDIKSADNPSAHLLPDVIKEVVDSSCAVPTQPPGG